MAAGYAVDLLSNASATGTAFPWPGGKMAFMVAATFGGGTVKLQQMGPDGSTMIDVANGSLTANGYAVVDVPAGQIRANVATATAVYAKAVRIPN